MRRCAAAGLFLGTAGVFVAAWHLQLWLVVVAMAAGAVTLVAGERIGERTREQRAAVWALYEPHDQVDGSRLEATLAVQLAAEAAGDIGVLDEAIAQTERQVADPWLRALATERLEAARRLATDAVVPRPPVVFCLAARRATLLGGCGTTAALTVAAAATQNTIVVVPLALSVAVVAVAADETRRQRALPDLLSHAASVQPPPTGVAFPDCATALYPLIGSGRRRLVNAIATPEPETNLTRAMAAWAAAVAVIIAAIELTL